MTSHPLPPKCAMIIAEWNKTLHKSRFCLQEENQRISSWNFLFVPEFPNWVVKCPVNQPGMKNIKLFIKMWQMWNGSTLDPFRFNKCCSQKIAWTTTTSISPPRDVLRLKGIIDGRDLHHYIHVRWHPILIRERFSYMNVTFFTGYRCGATYSRFAVF